MNICPEERYKCFYEEVQQTITKIKNNPHDTSRLISFVGKLEDTIKSYDMPERYTKWFFASLLIDNFLYNTIEEDKLKYQSRIKLTLSLAESLEKLLNNKNAEFSIFQPFLIEYQKYIVRGNGISLTNHKINDSIDEANNHELDLVSICDFDGPWNVAGLKCPYFINIDENLCDPNRNRKLVQAFDKRIKMYSKEIDWLCFIEKRKGPTGAILLMAQLVYSTGIPALIFRGRHLYTPSKLQGGKPKKGDRVCLLYDLSVTGGVLREVANTLKQKPFQLNVHRAMVLCDYGYLAKENLLRENIILDYLYQIPPKEVRTILYKQYKEEINSIANQFDIDKISLETFKAKIDSTMDKYYPLGMFAPQFKDI